MIELFQGGNFSNGSYWETLLVFSRINSNLLDGDKRVIVFVESLVDFTIGTFS